MSSVVLTSTHSDGSPLKAEFTTNNGLRLVSFQKNGIETLYEGNGLFIGPHFEERPSHMHPQNENDPYPYGIGRYAPWQITNDAHSLKATLSGKSQWQDKELSYFEGQSFNMQFNAELTQKGLEIYISTITDTDSVVGIDYYFRIPNGSSTITASAAEEYLFHKEEELLSNHFDPDNTHKISLGLDNQVYNHTFYPFPNPLENQIELKTSDYTLLMTYQCVCQENCWRIQRPENAPYVRLQALTSQDPYHTNLTVSSINIQLTISESTL